MRMMRWTTWVAAVLMAASPTALGAAEGPQYASPRTRALIERMVAAHGGLQRWRAAMLVSLAA